MRLETLKANTNIKVRRRLIPRTLMSLSINLLDRPNQESAMICVLALSSCEGLLEMLN